MIKKNYLIRLLQEIVLCQWLAYQSFVSIDLICSLKAGLYFSQLGETFVTYLLVADCMKPLLRGEDFDPRQQIQVSSEHYLFGDPLRVVSESVPWCVKDRTFKEWVQVDLGNITVHINS